jgi:phage terminase Nu1 subunit (DNA packaging protein)
VAKKKKAKKETARLVGIAAVAERLKLTPRRVQQLVGEGLPRQARGRYDVDQVLDWYIAKLERQLAGESGEEGSLVYNRERGRDRAAAADLKEIKLARFRRELVAIADVEKTMSDLVVTTKAAILAVPGRVSLSLVGADAEKIRETLDHELQAALSKLARTDSQFKLTEPAEAQR